VERPCGSCGEVFKAKRSDSVYCGERCKKRAQRGHKVSVAVPVGLLVVSGGKAVASVRAELETAGRVDTYLGALALVLAERIDGSTAVMGFAALAKELRVTMDVALAGVVVAADPVDELRARRDRTRDAG